MAVSVLVGIMVALLARELLQDLMEENREKLTRTRTSRRAVSTDQYKKELLSEETEADNNCEEGDQKSDETIERDYLPPSDEPL